VVCDRSGRFRGSGLRTRRVRPDLVDGDTQQAATTKTAEKSKCIRMYPHPIALLRSLLVGRLYLPGHADGGGCRRVWSALHKRLHGAASRCASGVAGIPQE
jgi:hypothetical protein